MLTDASYSGDKTMQLIYAGYEEVVGIYRIKVEYGNFKNDYRECWSQSFVGYYCNADEPYEDDRYGYPFIRFTYSTAHSDNDEPIPITEEQAHKDIQNIYHELTLTREEAEERRRISNEIKERVKNELKCNKEKK